MASPDLPALIARVGPRETVKRSCYDCSVCKSEHYAVQGDSGHDVYCTHPLVGRKHIADTSWATPDWCPALPPAAPLLAAECSRLQAEVTRLRAERDMPCAHRLEEERLQERVRALEEALRVVYRGWHERSDEGEASNWTMTDQAMAFARAALEGIESP